MNLINNPQEVIDSVNYKIDSIESIIAGMKEIMDKFGIQCPPKMLIPFGLTYFVNFFAQEIKV